ncbi:DEAD/DEAH box helicase [Streptococcus sanguinis]|uniref:DEAD-box ATP-dependent RNA helicase CshB n=1 Tax=Streptococcus sanguinis TaxID=1305 RepID=A0A2X3VTM0_STRSA|nr:DEAD/DEAH box helicase [Streptococcus sanguinis]EGF05647.1 DEAD/DEAH box family ATP-dependent RNA helicase [Streptococcus sanguinis SK1 = NCTC 7863]EGF22299.1 DEAD/DEAH box family ATP-dependent RNA helicase [Streptococcus sanguinis SK1058]EGJ42367.1 DEAD/DEAH box family ATP-dependent RNA helicase [Streptococcus sanguinis SK1059]EGQ18589.1 DEAD/DEAH box family ATP-dependent RNA helicase [Streptococcus sanguinis ATCC 29667]EGQ25508.1 DEAD/DEAH box family ATP-dependent RNA helicase [Streptococ
MKFTEFKFKDYIQEALRDLNFVEATPVQEKLIPVVLSGRDLVGESKTGSGKTHTFLLPIFQMLDEEADSVQAVITAPSRELAAQIYQAARQLASFSEKEIRVANYVGGTDKARQIGKLESSQPHIVIGTPGRIYDLVESGDLAIHKAKTFVVDEADMTLDMGFLATVDKIAGRLPKDLQFLVFSATIPQKLQPFLKKYLSNPVIEQIKTKTVIADTIENWLLSTKGRDKNAQIYQISQLLQPYLAMIFVNTKMRADELHSYLTAQGLKVAKIHGDIAPRERKRIMNQVKNLDFEYIVATDLAARGIDIEGVSHVINDAIPQDLSFFVHRVGRTGRNGLHGTAITLYQPSDDSDIRELEKMGIKFTPKMIKDDEFQDTYDRDRRANREKSREKLDTEMLGLVKKKKKKIKPGYKKKIQWAVNEKRRKTKRAENRARGRAERKAKRQSF